jgi:2-polyprenyl-3-methyl-5-hydroxy-6-metoxy-1,4-benzoquinol methylase
MDVETVNCCPLCQTHEFTSVAKYSYQKIWRQLGEVWGAQFSPEVVARHSPGSIAHLVECSQCQLRYFRSARAGDADFYRELSSSSRYYAADKWEFAVVRDRWCRDQEVLDVGCGDGRFLRLLEPAAKRAIGLETNPDAVARARGEGLDVRLQPVAQMAAERSAGFDVVCSFHVLEHLSNLHHLMDGMIACVKPGGLLIVSVPNRLRVIDPDIPEPLDCPPHHLSRWHPRQLAILANTFALEHVETLFDPPTLADCRDHVRIAAERLFRPIAEVAGRRSVNLLSRAISHLIVPTPLYRWLHRAALLSRLGVFRQNMLAVFRKSSDALVRSDQS